MSIDQPQNQSTYMMDAESGAEMARLLNLDTLLTQGLGGLLPEPIDLSRIHTILDIACGPGGWVCNMAHQFSDKEVTGIDISQRMIDYANAYAQVRGLDNARFRTMDATKPLDFPDESFDMINMRSVFGFMTPTAWPRLLAECKRINRPGGVIRLIDVDTLGLTNSPAFQKLAGTFYLALKRAGQSFSPDGHDFGLTPVLPRLLKNAGYTDIQKRAYVIDYSAGTEHSEGFYQNFRAGFQLVLPFMLKYGVITQEEFDDLYQQALIEMLSDDFCALVYFLSVWGTKP
ncbi:MAG TPA: methyltransferase domain-containing protein [Ktedonobacteraceae bacterium]|nr:methyltransferase domain-containing protein [Ktedonobacteraceae bacterium]